jgi:hypothetical protein
MNALVPVQTSNAEVYRASTDAAGLCREIVLKTAMEIQGRKYVKVEGWQAIAIAHGCTGSARDVEAVEGGVRAIGEIRRMSDGAVIAEAEGFVGADEPTWYGGTVMSYGKTKTLPKRHDYAIRAMAQTRAISRACRSAFAHVVVLIDANLSTTPAEEVPHGGFDDEPRNITPVKDEPKPAAAKAAPPSTKATASAKAPAGSLADRAFLLERALKDCTTMAQADAVWAKGAALCAQLDTSDPDRLAELTALYQLTEALPGEIPTRAKPDLGLNGDDVPEFR